MATRGRGCNSSASPDYHGGFGNAQIGYRHDAASNQLTGEAPARWSRIRTASPSARRWVRASPSSGRRGRRRGGANGNNVHTDWRGYAVVPS